MVKINGFHVGKIDVNLRGVWTHDPMKEKKFIPQVGLEPVTSKDKFRIEPRYAHKKKT